MWTVYILQCADGSLYTGITTDLPRRISEHERGTGARYTRGRGPFVIIYSETQHTKIEALKREREIKRLRRSDKLKLAVAWQNG